MKTSFLRSTTSLRMLIYLACLGAFATLSNAQTVTQYITTGDQSKLLEKQTETPSFTTGSNGNPTISLDASATYQTIDGFGYTLTQGSAYVLMTEISPAQRTALLQEMFDPSSGIAPGVGSSFLRIAIGASDMSQYPYTYNDLPAGQTDESQSQFSLQGPDLDYVVPVLQEIVAINPDIKIKAVPWTAPAWMKTNGSLSGGHLKSEYYASYATYFIKYLQAMESYGIPIYAVAPQNEPEHCCNNPAMLMTAQEQINFIMELGPAIQNAGFSTKILTWDHNCDVPEYPMEVLGSAAGQYIDGAAFHLYAGDISAMSTVHDAFPDKNMYFTEQYTGAGGSFLGDLAWHMKNVMLGGTNNWAKAVLEWNLAADASQGPHTEGGCSDCLGAYTVDAGNITRNVAYYNVAHMSKFVRPGAVRVASSSASGLTCAGFVNSSSHGSTRVLVVHNDNNQPSTTFNIQYEGRIATVTLPKKSVGTYIWSDTGTENVNPTASFTHAVTDLSVSFDASGSSDSDGTISSWSWDLGDGTSDTGESVSHTYVSAGDYTVTLTVTDNDGAVDTESQTIAVGSSGSTEAVFVQSLSTGTQSVGRGEKKGTAHVSIYNSAGEPVSTATVTGTFSGTFNETVSGETTTDGTVTLVTSATAKGGVQVDFCVDNITHPVHVYDASQNAITCTTSSARVAAFKTKADGQLLIYPNPVIGSTLYIQLEPQGSTEKKLVISDLSGKIVFERKLSAGLNRIELDHKVVPGIYLVKVSGYAMYRIAVIENQ